MADKKFNLRVITPHHVVFDEPVNMVIMRCTTGDMGILFGHEPRSVVLEYGVFRIFNDDANERWLAVYGGLAEIKDNVVTVLTGDAEWPHEVDEKHVREEQEQLQQLLQEHIDDAELRRAEALLRRSSVRIELASYRSKTDSED